MAWIFSQDKTVAVNIISLKLMEGIVDKKGNPVFTLLATSLDSFFESEVGRFSSTERALAVIKDFLGHLDTRGMVGGPGAYYIPSDDDAMRLI